MVTNRCAAHSALRCPVPEHARPRTVRTHYAQRSRFISPVITPSVSCLNETTPKDEGHSRLGKQKVLFITWTPSRSRIENIRQYSATGKFTKYSNIPEPCNSPLPHATKHHSSIKGVAVIISIESTVKVGKGHPCTGTEALYRPYGPLGEYRYSSTLS